MAGRWRLLPFAFPDCERERRSASLVDLADGRRGHHARHSLEDAIVQYRLAAIRRRDRSLGVSAPLKGGSQGCEIQRLFHEPVVALRRVRSGAHGQEPGVRSKAPKHRSESLAGKAGHTEVNQNDGWQSIRLQAREQVDRGRPP